MRFPSHLLLAGLTVLVAVGCSTRGNCQKSRFDRNADCCQTCSGNIQQVASQNLRTKIAAFVTPPESRLDQVESVIESERPPFESAAPRQEVAKSELSKSVAEKPDYSVKEPVPYENTQMKISPVPPSLSPKKSSRLAYQNRKHVSLNDELATLDPNPAAELESKAEDKTPEASPVENDLSDNLVAELDSLAPPTDNLTAPSTSVLESNDSTAAELQNLAATEENCNMIWQEESSSTTTERSVTAADSVGIRAPELANPVDQAIVGKVEKQIVLRARPQYRGTFIDSITRNSSPPSNPEPLSVPNEPAQQSFDMDPVDFQPLPSMKSAEIEVTSIEQPSDPPTTNLQDSQPTQVSSMPNMVPISKQKPATHPSDSDESVTSVPMLQASSKKMIAFPNTDSAAKVLKHNTMASPLLNNPKEILRLRATTGLSSDQRFPPIIRFNTQGISNIQSLEASQIKNGKSNQIRLLPPNVDGTNLPSYRNAPMIDHSRINESIRRLTVRPAAENQPAENTIDR